MRLHIALAGWLLGPASGANRRLLALLQELPAASDGAGRFTVLHHPGYQPPVLPGIEWLPLPIPATAGWRRHLAERRHLAACLRQLAVDVYEHGFLPLPRLPVPTCLLLHDLRHAEGRSRWPRWLARSVLRQACGNASAVVVPSVFTAQRLRHFVAEAPPIHVLPNGVHLPPHCGAGDGGHLLHLGHLEPRKNLAVLLHALALLPPAQRPTLILVGADHGSWRPLQQLAARLGLCELLQWRGQLPDPAAQEVIASARAVVLPSQYEGFGLAALEGLAAGRPVLAASGSAIAEVVGEHGLLLPPDDARAWANAIAGLPQRASEEPAAVQRRREQAARFDWAATARGHWRLWCQLAERSRSIRASPNAS